MPSPASLKPTARNGRAPKPALQSARTGPPAALVEWKGVAPIRQARSGATYQSLIDTGRAALENQSFGSTTIAGLARTAGTSVGAFYGRFENKDAYFAAIQETVVSEVADDVRNRLEKLDAAGGSAVEFLGLLAEMLASIFRDNKGLYRSAFKHSMATPDVWTPFKRLGWAIASMSAAKIIPRLAAIGRPTTERELRIAIQFMNGLLVNATINDPGPVHLEDAELVASLKRMLFAFLGVEAIPPSRAARSKTAKKAAKPKKDSR